MAGELYQDPGQKPLAYGESISVFFERPNDQGHLNLSPAKFHAQTLFSFFWNLLVRNAQIKYDGEVKGR